MNPTVLAFLQDPQKVSIIRNKLPLAFEICDSRLPGNPAVGILREHVVVALFIAFLGEDRVKKATSGVAPDVDCYVDGLPLSIKTITGSGEVRSKWTTTPGKVEEFLTIFHPTADILLFQIRWNAEGAIYFIPIEAQKDIFHRLQERYFTYRGETNTRGVSFSREAVSEFIGHPQTFSLPIFWHRSGSVQNPYQEWVRFWRNP
ncbi:MAG: ThaI family type II restriction endonuclease [Dehalococcoidia bacterium]|nr:ThaI family type II restriction endonuclease [Dehalococcoidia bacterium]MDW8119800.1 ThaI family type II restriction endonuclease [Chloroflexota bacterium]